MYDLTETTCKSSQFYFARVQLKITLIKLLQQEYNILNMESINRITTRRSGQSCISFGLTTAYSNYIALITLIHVHNNTENEFVLIVFLKLCVVISVFAFRFYFV